MIRNLLLILLSLKVVVGIRSTPPTFTLFNALCPQPGKANNWQDINCHKAEDAAIMALYGPMVTLDQVVNQESSALTNLSSLMATAGFNANQRTVTDFIARGGIGSSSPGDRLFNDGHFGQTFSGSTGSSATTTVKNAIATISGTGAGTTPTLQTEVSDALTLQVKTVATSLKEADYLQNVTSTNAANVKNILSGLAAAELANLTIIEQNMTAQAAAFAAKVSSSYTAPVGNLNMQLNQLKSSAISMNNSIVNTSQIITNLNTNFSNFKTWLLAEMETYMNTNAAIDFPKISNSLVDAWDKANTVPSLANITQWLNNAFKDPVLSFAPQFAQIAQNDSVGLSSVSTQFLANQTFLKSSASILAQMPAAFFQNLITNTSGTVSKFARGERQFRLAASKAAASANATFQTQTAESTRNVAAMQNEWQQLTNFLNGKPGALSAQLESQMAQIGFDIASAIVGQQQAGSQESSIIVTNTAENAATAVNLANESQAMMSSNANDLNAQLAKINQLMSTGSSGLNATLALFQQLLKGRASEVNTTVGSSLSSIATTLSGVTQQSNAAVAQATAAFVKQQQADAASAKAQIDAMASAGLLSTTQLQEMYASLASGNTQAFGTAAAQILKEQGVISDLTGSASSMVANLSNALLGVKSATVRVAALIQQAQTNVTSSVATLKSRLSTKGGVYTQEVGTLANSLMSELNAYFQRLIATATAAGTSEQSVIANEIKKYSALHAEMQSLSNSITNNQSTWMGLIGSVGDAIAAAVDTDKTAVNDKVNYWMANYTYLVSNALAHAENNVRQNVQSQVDQLQTAVIEASTATLTQLTQYTQGNASDINTKLHDLTNIFASIGSSQSNLNIDSKYASIFAAYKHDNETLNNAEATAYNQVADAFAIESDKITALPVSWNSTADLIYSKGSERIDLMKQNVSFMTDQADNALVRVRAMVNASHEYDEEYLTSQIAAEGQGIQDSYDQLGNIRATEMRARASAAASFSAANGKITGITDQIARALASATGSSGSGSTALTATQQALGLSSADAVNSLADSLFSQSAAIPGFQAFVGSGAAGASSTGSDAVTGAIYDLSGAANAATAAASTRTGKLLGSLQSMSDAYRDGADGMNQVNAASKESLRALMAMFASSNTVSDTGSQNYVDQLAGIDKGWTDLNQAATDTTNKGMASFTADAAAVQANLDAFSKSTFKSILDSASGATHAIDTASARARTVLNKFIPRENAVIASYSTVIQDSQDHLTSLKQAVGSADNAGSVIANEVSADNKITSDFYNWLPSLITASNQDLFAIQSRLS